MVLLEVLTIRRCSQHLIRIKRVLRRDVPGQHENTPFNRLTDEEEWGGRRLSSKTLVAKLGAGGEGADVPVTP